MGIKEDYLRLKKACISTKGEDKVKAEHAMEAFWASLSSKDEEELHAAINEDFEEIHHKVEEAAKLKLRMQLEEILPAISVSHLAKTYFSKSPQWFYQRLNENIVNGKPARFTEEERKKIADALLDISNQAKNIALTIR